MSTKVVVKFQSHNCNSFDRIIQEGSINLMQIDFFSISITVVPQLNMNLLFTKGKGRSLKKGKGKGRSLKKGKGKGRSLKKGKGKGRSAGRK